jgi:protoheme IX farnesyltransferase
MINYYLLTKPGIILGNLITFAAGFLLASGGVFDYSLFFVTLVGLALIMASACVFNNYIDRKIDKKMERTKNRPLVQGLITPQNAILFATLLGFLGGFVLFQYTHVLAVCVAGIGFFVYVVLYSFWKCHTVYGTAIGSIAGAVPPVVGYCAASQELDVGAFILFFMLVLWQMPHFFSIALFRFSDYRAAGMPVLPVMKGWYRTKVHMVLYIAGFILTSFLLTFFNYTGYLYFLVAAFFGLAWLALCLKGVNGREDRAWSRQMFVLSLITIGAICVVIPFDIVK